MGRQLSLSLGRGIESDYMTNVENDESRYIPADEKRQHLPGEDLRQPRVVHPRDLVEAARTHEPFPVHEYRRSAAASTPPSVTR